MIFDYLDSLSSSKETLQASDSGIFSSAVTDGRDRGRTDLGIVVSSDMAVNDLFCTNLGRLFHSHFLSLDPRTG